LLSRQQVRLLLPLGVAMALSLTGDSTLYAVLANQIDVVGISLAVVGVLLGANRLIRIPGNLLVGVINDRRPRRPLFLAGLTLGIVSTLSYSVAKGFWPLLLGRLLWGTAWCFINVGGYTMILDWSSSADRGRVTGFYQMAFSLGLTISPLMGGALTDALGFRPAVRVCAAISGVGLAVALAALPETRPSGSVLQPVAPSGRWQEFLAVWRGLDRAVLFAAYIYLVTALVDGGVLMSSIGLYLGQRWGSSIPLAGRLVGVASLTGSLLALRAVVGILAGPAAGWLSDRLGDRWPVARGAILVGMGGFVLLAFLGAIWAVPAGVVLAALGASALTTALAALVGDRAAGKQQGLVMGGLATARDIGSAAGPVLAFALAAAFELHWVYLFCAVLLASGWVVIVKARQSGGTVLAKQQ
jgi:MFS family permease